MKQDKLEKFIIGNRAEFDVYEPGPELWNRIKKPGHAVIRMSWKTIMWRAAAVVVIFSSSWLIHDWVQKDNTKSLTENESAFENPDLEHVNVLLEAEVFYTARIHTAREEIILLSGDNKGLLDEINIDMVELDKVFEELKNDLKDNSDNEEVIEAMIQNYRIKLEVLEEILIQLKKSQDLSDEKNQSDEI